MDEHWLSPDGTPRREESDPGLAPSIGEQQLPPTGARKEYRVVRLTQGDLSCFVVHVVYVDADSTPLGVLPAPACPYGDTIDELLQNIAEINQATTKPILDYHLLPKDVPDWLLEG